MAWITHYDKSGNKISKREFIDSQKKSFLGGNAVKVSEIKKSKTLISKKDLEEMQGDGLIEVVKFKNKKYLSKDELLYALKVQDRRRKMKPGQGGLF